MAYHFFTGGGLRVLSGLVWLDSVDVTDNTSGQGGGGVYVQDQFLCSGCTIADNTTNLSAAGGRQFSGGGVLLDSSASAQIYDSTLSTNTAKRGGGIAGGGWMDMLNCTVSGNEAQTGGGGLETLPGFSAGWAIAYTTIAGNNCHTTFGSEPLVGGGIEHREGFFEIGESIIAGNHDQFFSDRIYTDVSFSPDCATLEGTTAPWSLTTDPIISVGDNVWGAVETVACAIEDVLGGPNSFDIQGSGSSYVNADLVALATNAPNTYGTQTHALGNSSAAIDSVISGNRDGYFLFDCPADDQTGYSRPLGSFCDSGSFEF